MSESKQGHTAMPADSTPGSAPKPSSSVKLVLLGEAAVGKVFQILFAERPSPIVDWVIVVAGSTICQQ